jgi:GT2 family glycosyltransferase
MSAAGPAAVEGVESQAAGVRPGGRLLVVVLCYKVPELTIDCLRSLEPAVARVPGCRVTVCENGTGGDSADRIARAIRGHGWGGWVDLMVAHPNRGFTGGNNLVIREALASGNPPDYVHLLNADTIVEGDALAALVGFMDAHPRAGIAGSLLLSPEGEEQASVFRFMGAGTELNRGLQLGLLTRLVPGWDVVRPTPEGPSRGDWVSGASMILRRRVLEEVGLLDEGLYTYYDDIDLCLRAHRAGWETWCVPGSRVVHLEGRSTEVGARVAKRRPAYWFEARRRYFLKSHGAAYTALADAAFLGGCALRRLRRRLQGRPDADPPHFLADSWRHSVWRTGFRVRDVENPALVGPGACEAARLERIGFGFEAGAGPSR